MFEESRPVAVRAYAELRRRGLPDPHAFATAVRVLRYRCPQLSRDDAVILVADWLDEPIEQ